MHSTMKVYLKVPPNPVAADLREAQDGFGVGRRSARGTVGGRGLGSFISSSCGASAEALVADDDVHFAMKLFSLAIAAQIEDD